MPEIEQRPGLTDRERRVLGLIADGWTNPEMAAMPGLTSEIVKLAVSRILVVLAARNRAHAVATAYEVGLLGKPCK